MVVLMVTRDDPSLLLGQLLTGYWSVRTRANDRFITCGGFACGHGPEHRLSYCLGTGERSSRAQRSETAQ